MCSSDLGPVSAQAADLQGAPAHLRAGAGEEEEQCQGGEPPAPDPQVEVQRAEGGEEESRRGRAEEAGGRHQETPVFREEEMTSRAGGRGSTRR